MVMFVEVDPNEIPNFTEGRRGRVSYPILKSFLETKMPVAILDRTGMQQSFQALYSSLGAYIRNHSLPIKLFSRAGEIYLCRLDTNEDGEIQMTADEAMAGKWKPEDEQDDSEAKPIDAKEVASRFKKTDPTK